MADCKAYREEIEETAGGLSRGASAHLEACGACGAFRRERDSLRRLVGELGRVEAPADFEYRLRARMAATKNGGRKYDFFRLRLTPGLAWVAAAACFLAVSASLYLRQERRSPALVQETNTNEVAKGSPVGNGAARSEVIQPVPTGEAIVKDSGGVAAPNNASDNKGRNSSRTLSRAASLKVKGREGSLGGSTVADLHVATVIDGSDVAQSNTRGQMKPILLRTSPESLRFVLRDEHGGTRSVPMQTVSFGSQELVAGVNARVRPASNDKGGVW